MSKILVTNRRAFYQYQILERFEAGIVLTGAEVKSLREGRATLTDSFARIKRNEVFLDNFFIAAYQKAESTNYDPRRSRKLLLKKSQIEHLKQKITKSLTIVPLKVYTKLRGLIKIEIALAKGKKKYEKREAKKRKELKREIKGMI